VRCRRRVEPVLKTPERVVIIMRNYVVGSRIICVAASLFLVGMVYHWTSADYATITAGQDNVPFSELNPAPNDPVRVMSISMTSTDVTPCSTLTIHRNSYTGSLPYSPTNVGWDIDPGIEWNTNPSNTCRLSMKVQQDPGAQVYLVSSSEDTLTLRKPQMFVTLFPAPDSGASCDYILVNNKRMDFVPSSQPIHSGAKVATPNAGCHVLAVFRPTVKGKGTRASGKTGP